LSIAPQEKLKLLTYTGSTLLALQVNLRDLYLLLLLYDLRY